MSNQIENTYLEPLHCKITKKSQKWQVIIIDNTLTLFWIKKCVNVNVNIHTDQFLSKQLITPSSISGLAIVLFFFCFETKLDKQQAFYQTKAPKPSCHWMDYDQMKKCNGFVDAIYCSIKLNLINSLTKKQTVHYQMQYVNILCQHKGMGQGIHLNHRFV